MSSKLNYTWDSNFKNLLSVVSRNYTHGSLIEDSDKFYVSWRNYTHGIVILRYWLVLCVSLRNCRVFFWWNEADKCLICCLTSGMVLMAIYWIQFIWLKGLQMCIGLQHWRNKKQTLQQIKVCFSHCLLKWSLMFCSENHYENNNTAEFSVINKIVYLMSHGIPNCKQIDFDLLWVQWLVFFRIKRYPILYSVNATNYSKMFLDFIFVMHNSSD